MEYQFSTIMGSLSVDSFIDNIENEKIKRPGFQREYVWSESGAEKFIRNIKSNYFIQQIILFVYDDKIYILDGQQRLTSLYLYKKGKFKSEINWDEIIKLERENETNLPEWSFAVNDADKGWLKERELSYVLLQ